jgi:hypothetical protein
MTKQFGIRITNTTALPWDTEVTMPDGYKVPGVSRIALNIGDDRILKATIDMRVAALDVHAHPLLGLETVREAAAAHGYRLVPLTSDPALGSPK